MGSLPGLDIDLLRTFALIAEDGSFTRAAERVGRTQSAVSLQIQRLEALVGHRVFLRGKGGAVRLTPQGQTLLRRAAEMLALNDDILGSLRAEPKQNEVRLGLPPDYIGLDAADMLLRFSRSHPDISVDVLTAPSCTLVPLLKSGDLDLMVCESGIEPRQWPSTELWRGRLHWITAERHARHHDDPLPLILSPGNCPWRPPWLDECEWRGAALRALDTMGRRYRIVSTSPSVSDMQKAVLAGLGVTVSTLPGLSAGLRALRAEEGLPELPETAALLLKGREPRQPVTDQLAEHIVATFTRLAATQAANQTSASRH